MEFYYILRLMQLTVFVLLQGHLNGVEGSTIWNSTVFTQSNCSLIPAKKRQPLLLDNIVEQENRLITLDVKLHWTLQLQNSSYPEERSWFMTTDSTGKRLLLLNDNFTSMSLQTLSYSIAHAQFSFIQEPADCLANFTTDDIEKSLMFTLLKLPKDSKSMNDEDISFLHICTGSVNSNGSCCDLTLNGENISCDKLINDSMFNVLSWIIIIIANVALAHCPYLIPKSVYKKDGKSSYNIPNNTLGAIMRSANVEDDASKSANITEEMGVYIEKNINGERFSFYSNERFFYSDSFIDGVSLGSITIEDSALISELHHSKGLFRNLYKTVTDIFCRCFIKDYKICWHCCYGKPFLNHCRGDREMNVCYCFQCLQTVSKLVLIFIFLTPLAIRVAYDKFDHLILGFSFSITVIIVLLFCLCIYAFNLVNVNIDIEWKKIIEDVLQNGLEKRAKKCLSVLLPPFNFMNSRSYFKLPFTLVVSLLYFLYLSFPLINLLVVLYLNVLKNSRGKNKICKGVLYLLCYSMILITLILITDCIVFCMKCLVYIFIGLFFNYDDIIDEMVLIFLIISYVLDCLNGVYNKINTFNQTIFTLIEESNKEVIEEMFAQARKENVAFRISPRYNNDRTKTNCVGLFVGYDGKIFHPVTGLYLFYKYKEHEDMPYLHIPEIFLDQMASKYSNLTPGSRFLLFYKALREIFCMIFLVIVAYIVVDGYSRDNNVSATVHTLVTVGTSTLLVLVNKIMFRIRLTQGKEYNLQLKELLERQLQEFQYLWIDAEICIKNTDGVSCPEHKVPKNTEKMHKSAEVVAVVNGNERLLSTFQLWPFDDTDKSIQEQEGEETKLIKERKPHNIYP